MAGPIALCAVAIFAPRAAAGPFTVDPSGAHAHVAVDDSGTGHVVWIEKGPSLNDILHYCRLPRGAKACASKQSFPLPGIDVQGPRVLVGNGQVILLTPRCCFGGYQWNELVTFTSSNGGKTFSGPVIVGDNTMSLDGDAAFGPGDFGLSTVGAETQGILFQAAPLGGPPVHTRAQLDNDVPGPTGDTNNPSLTFVDPLTPIVTFTNGAKTFARLWGGSGNYNDVGTWEPTSTLGNGDDPRLAGGPRGTFLLNRVGKPAKKRYVVRRYTGIDAAQLGFGSPISVSATGTPIFPDLFEDAGGTVHAAWVDNGSTDHLRYRRSASTTKVSDWGTISTLASGSDSIYTPDIGAAPDGGGWVVWTTGSGSGRVRAAPFRPVGKNEGGGCVKDVVYRKSVALAKSGCFKRNGSVFRTEGSVRLNGLDLLPAGGSGARVSSQTSISIDKAKGTLKSTGKVLAKAGNVKLDNGPLAWRLPKAAGQIHDLAGNPAVFDTGKIKVDFLGLRVLGQTSPSVQPGQGMRVPVHLRLPSPFDSLLGGFVSANSTLVLDNKNGLHLKNVHLHAASIWMGIAEVRNLDLAYNGGPPYTWQGSADIVLPVVQSKLHTMFGLKSGDFDYGTADLEFDPPGRPVSQFTYLKKIGFDVKTKPLRIAGTATVTAGPTVPVLNVAPARVDGTVNYTFPDAPAPGVFRAQGDGYIVNIPTAHVFAQYETSGKLSMGGDFSIGALGADVSGSVDGVVDVPHKSFDLLGAGTASGIPAIPVKFGVTALLSSKAVAGCGTAHFGFPPVSLSGGLGHPWSDGFDFFLGCDLSTYKAVSRRGGAGASATTSFRMPKGLPQANVAVQGDGAAPQVRLVAPGGATLTSPTPPATSATGDLGAIGPNAGQSTTYTLLRKPAAGAWRLEELSGSAPITRVLLARGLPKPKVSGGVRRVRGRQFRLSFRARRIAGQRLRFYEMGRGVAHRIDATRKAKGRIDFRAADGPRSKRSVVALVDSNGSLRARLKVAKFQAPRPVLLRAPRKLRARRRGSKLVVGWKPMAHAARYAVRIRLRDGRRLTLVTQQHGLTVKRVPGIDSASIMVSALKADNTPGRTAKTRLRAHPKHHHRREKHHWHGP